MSAETTSDTIRRWAAELAAGAPPLTPRQIERLWTLLRGPGGGVS